MNDSTSRNFFNQKLLPLIIAMNCCGGVLAEEGGRKAALEEVVVQARKVSENAQEVPIAITALTAEALKEAHVTSPSDLQFLTPSLQANRSFSTSDNVRFTIRGQSQADMQLTTDSSIGVYVDGVYRPRTSGLTAALFDLERVEVLKGPQGTLYGKNTTGGAVGIYTRKPDTQEDLGGFVELGAGSFENREVRGGVNAALIPGELAVRAVVSYKKDDGYAEAANNRPLADRDDKLARIHLAYNPSDSVQTLLTYYIAEMDNNGSAVRVASTLPFPNGALITNGAYQLGGLTPANIALATNAVNADIVSGNRYRTHATRPTSNHFSGDGASFTLDWDMDAVAFKSVTAISGYKRKSAQDFDGTAFESFEPTTGANEDFLSQELMLSGDSFNDTLHWSTGLYYSIETGTEWSNSRIFPYIPQRPPIAGATLVAAINNARIENISQGAYGQATYDLTDRLSLTAGLRRSGDYRDITLKNRSLFTGGPFGGSVASVCSVPRSSSTAPCEYDAEQVSFPAWSWVMAANYSVTDDILAYATTRRGFRTGGYNARANTDPSSIQPFSPEIARDFEIGMKSDWLDSALRVNVSVFRTESDDIQKTVVVPAGATTVTIIQNAAKGEVNGAELEVQALLSDSLTGGFTYTYTDTKYEDYFNAGVDISDEPWEVPQHTASMMGKYTIPLSFGDLSFRADYYWRSETIFTSASHLTTQERVLRQGAYGLIGARIALEMPERDMEVALIGRNLADKEYDAGGLDLTTSGGFKLLNAGEPRYVGIEFSKKFGGD
jgi:iron complex outermembrane receptor protein